MGRERERDYEYLVSDKQPTDSLLTAVPAVTSRKRERRRGEGGGGVGERLSNN